MPGTEGRRIHGLYVIIDPSACSGRSPLDVAAQAIDGGASVIQWRDKTRAKGVQLEAIRPLVDLCRARGVPLIVNDHADLAAAAGADGVHLGQQDLPIGAARQLLGRPSIIGVSTNSGEEACRAQEAGADYVAVGSVFATKSKHDTRPADLDRVREVKQAVRIPVVAIGGIAAANISSVVAAGADAAAVIGAVCGAGDIRAAARELAAAFPTPPESPQIAEINVRRQQTIRRAIDAFVESLRQRDRDEFLSLFASDGIIQEGAGVPSGVGRDALGAWWDRLVARQPSFQIDVHRVHVPGDEAALWWSIRHDHEGHEQTAHGFVVLSFEGSLIASVHPYWDRDPHPSPGGERAREAVERFVGAINKRDRDAYGEMWANEALHQDPVGGPTRIGRANILAAFDRAMALFSSLQVSIDKLCTSGDEAAVAWTSHAQGEAGEGVFQGIDIFTVDAAGLITGLHSYREPGETPSPSTET